MSGLITGAGAIGAIASAISAVTGAFSALAGLVTNLAIFKAGQQKQAAADSARTVDVVEAERQADLAAPTTRQGFEEAGERHEL
jgi:hypothetical protein